MKGLNKNIIMATVVMVGIFTIIPAVGAEELKVAQDFQYPTTHEGLKADWDYYTPSDSLGFGIWNDFFQSYHLGQDTSIYLTLTDKKIYAAADGIVRVSDNKNWGGYGSYDAKTKKQGKGYAVVIEHKLPNGSYVTSLYGHIQPGSTLYNEEKEIGLVPVGTTVKKGQYIAKVADYLLKNENNWHHLHFGIRKGQYTKGHDADYIAGYNLTGWTEAYTKHDTWYNPSAFVLDRMPPSITLVSPVGGEIVETGSELNIQWSYFKNPGEDVSIEILKNGIEIYGYCPAINTGSSTLTIPESFIPGEDYQVRVTAIKDGVLTKYSDISGYFTIPDYCSAPILNSIKTSAISTNPCTPPPSPPNKKLDLVIMSDTTGSMEDDIAQVKASANEIVNALDSEGLDYRIAIADYKDYPVLPYGDPSDYVYKLDLPFTGKDNKQTIIDAIDGLNASGGNDEPESVYSALVHAMQDPAKDPDNSASNGWRNGVTKAIIVMGDAPPHMPEPWADNHTLADVIYTSEHIDPVIVYSVAVGTSVPAFDAFANISDGTNGKVYSSPTASDIVPAIIEVIGDIGQTPENRGVLLNITPTVNKTVPGKSASYTINVTNTGNIADTYNLTLEPKGFKSFQKAYPTAIQPSWTTFSSVQITLNPNTSVNKLLTIAIPPNWAGMEDAIYSFNVTAISTTNVSIGNTSSAKLKVKADKKSMAFYLKIKVQWLREQIQSSNIDQKTKNELLNKLAKVDVKLDTAIANIDNKQFKGSLNAAQELLKNFIKQFEDYRNKDHHDKNRHDEKNKRSDESKKGKEISDDIEKIKKQLS